ncbi:MAG: N-acetylmuramoyl-L-alanine amidase [Rickettsiaceae bacterium]|nr:N-acetylmuramoyl-L-alanine amidase [Rickettsiaceae bacterium]MDP4832614.1 N-acetylmuramoyl-L-alanine amidase [Rickettsiaceae bacterium]MDP5021236.1 N-acetylmuramoyl-L-alanine amidase [Rickettsiaceae bacterium]MDP5083190.1 N-acetylmuramoyl-L-alanine amidase [Rickettsiaceae bacterium]
MLINNNFSSPNYSTRSQKLEHIMVHFTEMLFVDALKRLTDKTSEVSAHYLIKADGTIYQLVDDANIAWHAGKSSWHGVDSLNQNSVGIELDNLGNCKFNKPQMQACIELGKFLLKKYDIAANNFIGHSDVAPDRKVDPGIFFDWKLCAKNGLGVWHNLSTPKKSELLISFGDKGSAVTNLQTNLRRLGYPINISSVFDTQTNFVVRAFQSKFYPECIHQKGLAYYINNNSQYSWCSFSEDILQNLLV